MKNRFRMYLRDRSKGGKVWWCQDSQEGTRESLRTTDKNEARRLLDLKNQPHQFAGFHVQMARTHLLFSDPQGFTRTWQAVMDAIISLQKGSTKARWERAAESQAFDSIRNLVVADTKADKFLDLLGDGKVSTNVYLRRLHNFALRVNWLLAPVIAKEIWPKVTYGEKRAITLAEHHRILEREQNLERRAFYALCWFLGGSQSDVANLSAENIDWENRTVSFDRKKTRQNSRLTIGAELERVLRSLPSTGKLFPYLATVREADRATEFRQRCDGLGIKGVTLHSYRYAWAERAKAAGYPERYAQIALGHGSKAIARAYARNADVQLPSLEDYGKSHARPGAVAEILPMPTALAA